jgi:Fe-Mn family superoxide dismutase
MPFAITPLGCDPRDVKSMSEQLIVRHYATNYGGAAERPNFATEQLANLASNAAAGFFINGLRRKELIATNSKILRRASLIAWGGEWTGGDFAAAVAYVEPTPSEAPSAYKPCELSTRVRIPGVQSE